MKLILYPRKRSLSLINFNALSTLVKTDAGGSQDGVFISRDFHHMQCFSVPLELHLQKKFCQACQDGTKMSR